MLIEKFGFASDMVGMEYCSLMLRKARRVSWRKYSNNARIEMGEIQKSMAAETKQMKRTRRKSHLKTQRCFLSHVPRIALRMQVPKYGDNAGHGMGKADA